MSPNQYERIVKQLLRIEKMLSQVLDKVPDDSPKRLTEKQMIEKYGVSINILRRMRLGYTRSDGFKIGPVLFRWGHINGRRFDYDVEEFEKVFKRNIISEFKG